jgi:hypothetical protein
MVENTRLRGPFAITAQAVSQVRSSSGTKDVHRGGKSMCDRYILVLLVTEILAPVLGRHGTRVVIESFG